MKLSDIYSEYFANWISSGNLIARDKLSLLGIKSLYDRFITHSYITKVWCVIAVPVEYNTNLTQAIRMEMFERCPSVKTIVRTVNTPVAINPSSDVFVRQLKRTANAYTQYKDIFENLREDEQLTGSVEYDERGHRRFVNAQTLTAIKNLYDSYTYVFDSSTHNQEFTETYFFILASAKNKADMRKYKMALQKFIVGEGITAVEMKGNINVFLDNFCPASYEHSQVRKIQPMLLSQENLASITNYKNKGLVGDKGVLIAIDWQTKLPFMQDYFHSGAAQVNLICSKSGWGKSYLGFIICLSTLGYYNTHASVVDIKGREWVRIVPFIEDKHQCRIIDMDQGIFVNTMRLDDLQIDSMYAEEFFNAAVSDTVRFFKIVVNMQENEGNERDLEDILFQAVMKMYYNREVIADNAATFKRTADMHYKEIIEIVNDLAASSSYTEEQKFICKLIVTRCSAFFISESGKGSDLKKEITVQDILDSPFTIYSFNKNSNAELDLLDDLRVFMVQTLDSKKATIRKLRGLFTAAFYEELQRCVNSKELIRYISSKVTGSRSDNLIVFLLMNSITALKEDSLAQIRSNITSYLIGKVTDKDREIIANEFDCAEIEHYVNVLNSDESEFYRNCFAVKFDDGHKVDNALIKVQVPKELSEAFQTRDVMSDG